MGQRRLSKIEISMFPFLSVLCTVIGVMMLLIVLVISTRAEKSTDEQPQGASPGTIGPASSGSTGISKEQYNQLHQRIRELESKLQQRQREYEELNKLIGQLEELIAAKTDPNLEPAGGDGLVHGLDLEPPEDVQFVPHGEPGFFKRARFIEVQADRFIVHPEKRVFAVEQLEQTGSPLRQFLEEADRARQKEYLLFLIHPNGAAAFHEMLRYLVEHFPPEDDEGLSRIDIGKEPFSKGWLLVSQSQDRAE